MERMGHDTMRAALIYQHTSRDADRRIADAIAQRITPAVDSTSDSDAASTDTTASAADASCPT